MSCQMLDLVRDSKHLDDDVLTDAEVVRIKQLIDKNARTTGQATVGPKAYLFDIVANERNGIDVDKFDYLERDSINCQIKISCDFGRLPMLSMVRGNQICFKSSEAINIRELFHSRELMHRQVYTHKAVLSVDFMHVDALVLAAETLGLRDMVHSARDFLALDDSIFRTIENYGTFPRGLVLDEGMKEAQALMQRIRNRDLYVFVNELVVPAALVDSTDTPWVVPTAQDIISHYSKSEGVHLRAEDVIVWENKIDYAMKGSNPLDHVRFFDSFADDQGSFAMTKEQISSMMPSAFQERAVRLYSKVKDVAVVRALGEAFHKWAKFRFPSGLTVPKTPLKQPRQEQLPALLHGPEAAARKRLRMEEGHGSVQG